MAQELSPSKSADNTGRNLNMARDRLTSKGDRVHSSSTRSKVRVGSVGSVGSRLKIGKKKKKKKK